MKPALGMALIVTSMIAAPLPACSPAAPSQEGVTLALPSATSAGAGATSDGPSAARPPLLRCDLGGDATPPASRPERKQPMAGQMTEEAARAKRLYDSEKWPDAVTALTRVANGDTGDDEGNKELAEYHLAAALFRMQRVAESARAFRAIASRRDHIKHLETLLWLTKLASDHPEFVDAADFQRYTGDDIGMFNNSSQHTVYDALVFFLGRARMQSRELGEAARWLGAVPAGSRYASEARECLGVVQKAH